MSDYYWQKSLPTDLHIDYITQLRYRVHPKTNEYFQIKQTNLHSGVTLHRVYLPSFYRHSVTRFLWHLFLVVRLYNSFKKSKDKKIKAFMPSLLQIMVHLDNVVEALIRPAVGIPVKDIPHYRSQNFHEYLITEYLLSRHDPVTVQQLRSKSKINIEQVDIGTLDWGEYKKHRIHKMLEGGDYKHEIDNVPKKDLAKLWDLAEAHYTRPLDLAWISKYVDLEEEDDQHAPEMMEVDSESLQAGT